MTIPAEELTDLAAMQAPEGTVDGMIATLAAELIAARAKIEAAEKLAEAVKNEREMVCQDMGMQMAASAAVDQALAAWEAAQ